MGFDSYSLVLTRFTAIHLMITAVFLALGTLGPSNDKIVVRMLLMKVYRQQFVRTDPVLQILVHIFISIIMGGAALEAGLLLQAVDRISPKTCIGNIFCC